MNKNFFKEKIFLKNLSFPKIMAAPMDGIIDSPTRRMIREFSKDELLFTEMRHVSLIANQKNEQSLKYEDIERPLAFQVSANKQDFLEEAIEKILEKKFDMLNLNAGCPAKNIIKSKSGSALMADPKNLEKLIKIFVKKIDGKIPFTIKIQS